MNKFSNLKKLFNEIELLESAGLYKAANVLHKKFVKEAQQYYPSNSSTKEDRAPILNPGFDDSMQIREYILNYAKDIKSLGNKAPIPKTIMNLKEQDFIKKVQQGQIDPDLFDKNNVSDYAFILSNQANTPSITNQGAAFSDPESAITNRLQISPEVLKYAEDIIKNGDYPMPKHLGILNDKERDFIQKVKKGQVDPVLFNEALMTKNQLFSQGLSDAGKQQNTQNALLNNTNNKAFEGLGNVINSGQAKKTQPILNEKEESAVYKRTVDQIRSILSRKNVPAAEKLAKDYQNYFSNPQRNVAFQNQVNRIFSEFKQKSPFGSSVASQPEMSDEEGQTLTQLVNTNVQRNMQTNGNAQPNTQPTNNPSNPALNNQLFTMINNFYGNRYTPTDISQMWNDLKSDSARANIIRYKIKALRNPALLDLFEQKLK